MDFHRIQNVDELNFDDIKDIIIHKTENELFDYVCNEYLEGSFGIVYFHDGYIIKKLKDIDKTKDLNSFCYIVLCSELISSLKIFCHNFLNFHGFRRITTNNKTINFLCYERVDGDLYDLFRSYRITPSIIKNLLFQVCTSLFIARSKIGFTHQDLHCGNILFSKNISPDCDYFYYIIDDIRFNIPYSEFLFMITDFDTSIIDSLHGTIENKNLTIYRERKTIKVKYPLSETGDMFYFIYDLFSTFKQFFNKYLTKNLKKMLLSIINFLYYNNFDLNDYFKYFESSPEDIKLIDFMEILYEFIKYSPVENEKGFCLGKF